MSEFVENFKNHIKIVILIQILSHPACDQLEMMCPSSINIKAFTCKLASKFEKQKFLQTPRQKLNYRKLPF